MSDNDTRPSLESILFPCPEQNGGGRLRLRECDVVMGQSSGRIELLYNHNLNIQAKFEDSSTRQSPQKESVSSKYQYLLSHHINLLYTSVAVIILVFKEAKNRAVCLLK